MADQTQQNQEEQNQEETVPVKDEDGNIKQVPISEFEQQYSSSEEEDAGNNEQNQQDSDSEPQEDSQKDNDPNENKEDQDKKEALSKLKQKLQEKKKQRGQEKQSKQPEQQMGTKSGQPENKGDTKKVDEDEKKSSDKEDEASSGSSRDAKDKTKTSSQETKQSITHKSPLEEGEPDISAEAATPKQSGVKTSDEQLREVLSRISFDIAPDLYERCRSLITSRRKGVRDDDQLKSYLQRKQKEGGLALSQASAEEFLEIIHDYFSLDDKDYAHKKVQAKRQQTSSATSKRAEPQEDQEAVQAETQKKDKKKQKDDQTNQPEQIQEGTLEYDQTGQLRPKMKDVKAPEDSKKQGGKQQDSKAEDSTKSTASNTSVDSVGPIEEIAQLDWEQFRHFSQDPQEAKQRVLEKFDLLYEESFLLFLDARSKWYDNPIVADYHNLLKKSVNTETSLQEVVSNYEREIDFAEIQAIIEINRELS